MLSTDEQLIKHIISFFLSVEIAVLLRLGREFSIKGKLSLTNVLIAHLTAFGFCYYINSLIVASDREFLIRYYQFIIGLSAFLSSVVIESLYNKRKLITKHIYVKIWNALKP